MCAGYPDSPASVCLERNSVPNSRVMLRYNCNLTSLRGKAGFFISPKCHQMHLTNRPNALIAVDNSHLRFLHGRSRPIPSSKAETETGPENKSETEKNQHQEKKFFHKTHKSRDGNEQEFSSRDRYEDSDNLKNRYQEFDSTRHTRYELEAARPRNTQNREVYNVFKIAAKEIDLNDYLQPNNLKPFGSHDHLYMPILMSNKNSCLLHTNPSYQPPDSEARERNNDSYISKVKGEEEDR